MFYGINKSKNGKEISNYDKYTPWADGEFSGKICYELDNTENFEVYRNFTKRAPQIFDKNANDISKNFTIDKNEGNKFFYDQTKVDEDLLEELEEILIMSDIGVETSTKIIANLRDRIKKEKITDENDVKNALKEEMIKILEEPNKELELNTKPSVILVVGVNGVRKNYINR